MKMDNKIIIYILGISLIISMVLNMAEQRKLSFFENKFGAYQSFITAQNKANKYVEMRQHPILIYMKKGAPEDSILKFKESFSGLAGIENIEYISPDQTLKNLISTHPCGNNALCDIALDLPFGASLVVVLNDQAKKGIVADFIKSHDFDSIVHAVEMP